MRSKEALFDETFVQGFVCTELRRKCISFCESWFKMSVSSMGVGLHPSQPPVHLLELVIICRAHDSGPSLCSQDSALW